MFFVREIKYLYYYEKSNKSCSAGTCKCQIKDGKVTLDLCLKKLPLYYPLQAKLCFTSGNLKTVVEQQCCFQQTSQEYRFVFSYPQEEICGEKLYCYFQIASDKVISDEKTLFEYITKRNINRKKEEMENTNPEVRHRMLEKDKNRITEHEKPEIVKPDYSQFPEDEGQEEPTLHAAGRQSVVHIPDITGKKETYYVVAPEQLKEFGLGFSEYEDNSFLLHGYYNYRHILVGPVSRDGASQMRIGVPGNYYKREDVVAKMFGFVDFVPAKGEIRTGAFGYYYTAMLILEEKECLTGNW